MSDAVEWRVEPGLLDYPAAVAAMEARVAAIRDGTASELIWLVEHPALYTAGTSAAPGELLDTRFPVHVAGRGGRYTYHGPGQRVVYVMLDLAARGRDVRRFVAGLETWAIDALADLGVVAHVVPGRVGIWTGAGGAEAKIGAIGIRLRQWVSFHGMAINAAPDLEHFSGIVPCGIDDAAVTSLAALGHAEGLPQIDAALRATMPRLLNFIGRSGIRDDA